MMADGKRAVFLDRDGVLSALVLNPQTGEHESPHVPANLRIMPGAAAAAQRLQEAGYLLFVVSNQPSYAKGKATLENIQAIAAQFDSLLRAEGVALTRAYYCYHHPQGIVPEYSYACLCRKPKPQFLFDARDEFALDLRRSWMIGDRETDVECGRRAGCRTILIKNPLSAKGRSGRIRGTLSAKDLADAVAKLLACKEKEA